MSSAYRSQFMGWPSSIVIPAVEFCSVLASMSGIRLKSYGDEHAPCLTPLFTRNGVDLRLFSFSALVSFAYALLSMSVTVLSIPVLPRVSKSSCLFTLSKAFYKSMRMTCSSCPLASCIWSSSSRVSIWSVVLRCRLKPYWGSARKFVLSRC